MAMPSDITGDDVGAPALCAHHGEVIRNLEAKDHVGDAASIGAAIDISKQCPQCVRSQP